MRPGPACRQIADVLRETANALPHGELRAEYEYLVRGFLRLAKQFEQDMENVSHDQNQDLIRVRRSRSLH